MLEKLILLYSIPEIPIQYQSGTISESKLCLKLKKAKYYQLSIEQNQ